MRSIRMACRVALCCLVARPRTWKQRAIIESEGTVWQRAMEKNHRVITTLFAGNEEAVDAMEKLALAVIRLEKAEIIARKASPENTINNALVSAVHSGRQEAAEDRAKFNAVLEQLKNAMCAGGSTDASSLAIPPPQSEQRPVEPPSLPTAVLPAPSGRRIKRKREYQDDVEHFASWRKISDALEYARTKLAPMEKEQGNAWRVVPSKDGGEPNRGRDAHWMRYKKLAFAIGLQVRDGKSYEHAVEALQARLDAFGGKGHTPLLKAIVEETKDVHPRDKDDAAKEILGY